MNTKIIKYVHAGLTIVLAAFFINAGVKKFVPKPLRPVEEQQLVEVIIKQQSYTAPVGYNVTMNTFRTHGFLKCIGIFQLLAGAFMLIPRLRLAGLLILLPIILNIFLMHVFLDNRPHENVETGILFGLTVLLTAFYYKRLFPVVWAPDNK